MSVFDSENNEITICIIGLGYVGLPLALLMSKKYNVIGFDIDAKRVDELRSGYDRTNEVDERELGTSTLRLTTDEGMISQAHVVIITVPTPVDKHNIPDLTPLKTASQIVGRNIIEGTTVIIESTVYPGVTEDICVPILEKESGLKWKEGFFVGYSPERVNPGDKVHTIEKITKIVSGDTQQTVELLNRIYGSVINGGLHIAPSIKVAEAAKVIENTQRDLNIALMNELSMIFHRMDIDTKEVLEAAGTKWNFLRFEPGLVGGHCIGVDPYYLTFKAEEIGYHPQVILAGRRINDNVGKYIAENVVKEMIKREKIIYKMNVLIMGIAFKENIGDIRNSKVIDIYNELKQFGINLFVFDPVVHNIEVKREYGIELIDDIYRWAPYDSIIIAVKHDDFIKNYDLSFFKKISKNPPILFDIKGVYNKNDAIHSGFLYWRL
ncbi:MAG: nucleotide sugar dehydrogenase [Spirochaetota bacterium]